MAKNRNIVLLRKKNRVILLLTIRTKSRMIQDADRKAAKGGSKRRRATKRELATRDLKFIEKLAAGVTIEEHIRGLMISWLDIDARPLRAVAIVAATLIVIGAFLIKTIRWGWLMM